MAVQFIDEEVSCEVAAYYNKKSSLTKDRDCLICHWVTAVVFEMASKNNSNND